MLAINNHMIYDALYPHKRTQMKEQNKVGNNSTHLPQSQASGKPNIPTKNQRNVNSTITSQNQREDRRTIITQPSNMAKNSKDIE